MKLSPQTVLWLNAVLAEAIEGAADAFLVTSGGAALAQSGAVALPALAPKQLFLSSVLGAAWYVASFLKKHPTPAAFAAAGNLKAET